LKLALAGDTMLGRGVAQALIEGSAAPLAPEVLQAAAEADLFLVNLECCISARGERWPAADKPFFFRAPPHAAEVLAEAGIQCVTLANNHALDFGARALLDTFEHLRAAGIRWVGAGPDLTAAREAVRLSAGEEELAVLACADHPRDFAAQPGRPGIAFADLRPGVPRWLLEAVSELAAAGGPVMVAPHWGPNMTAAPLPFVRRAAAQLREAGATLVAGHSAHVFHGVAPGILYDLGDFLDDYAVQPELRNDLGLLFLVTLEQGRAIGVEAVPLKLDYCHTRLATGEDADWISRRFKSACEAFGTPVEVRGERLIAPLSSV
jgi:poly-gamma-glutamate capsule biosynthesis protein CapA/YwtB (metallophosphatase superfamily)